MIRWNRLLVLKTPGRAALAALLIATPTLFAGFLLDDHIHLLTLAGEGYGAAPFDLFRFASGDAERTRALVLDGPFPWYTFPDLKLHFFRPLSSASMVLDHALFGTHAFGYHLHSLLWYGLMAWGVAWLYRRCLAAPAAALAALLYVLDETHLVPVLWWSNRNALVACAPAVLGLAAHVRWREDAWRPGLPLSLLGYALGLLGGEPALGIFGYLVAYEGLGRMDRPLARLQALKPGLALAGAYLLFYKGAGYGVFGSGVYLDPVTEWPQYLLHAPGRLIELTGTQFFSLPAELAVVSNRLGTGIRLAALAGTVVLVVALRQLWRELAPEARRTARWFAAGALISAAPALATFPSGRLLLLPSIGACALIALAIQHGLAATAKPGRRVLRVFALISVVFQVVLSPLAWVGASIGIPVAIAMADAAFHDIEMDSEAAPDQWVFTLCAADPYTGFYPHVMRRRMGYPEPRGWQNFSIAPFEHEVTRTDENAFEVAVVDGELLSTPFERLLRSPRHPLPAGEVLDFEIFRVEILAAGAWGPSRFRIILEHNLDDPRYRFLAWQGGVLRSFTWPAIGQPVRLSPSEGYFAWQHFKKRLPLL